MLGEPAVIVTARNEADRLADTLAALRETFPRARILVADDASTDATAHVALQAGAELVRAPRRLGKGGVANLAAQRLGPDRPLLVLCDGDLGASAAELPKLVDALERGEGDLAVGAFARRVGGGFGIALTFARAAILRLTGLRPEVLDAVLPFAEGFGMEIGMTVDAHRAGFRLLEVELDLEHRATGRTAAGFVHRARQLRDFVRVYCSRA